MSRTTIQNIKDGELARGLAVSFYARLASKKILLKNNGDEYMMLTAGDETGDITFPVWDNFQASYDKLEVDTLYHFSGVVSAYNGDIQLKNPSMRELKEEEVEMYSVSDFYPPVESYAVSPDVLEDFAVIISRMKNPWRSLCQEATGLNHEPRGERWKRFTTWVSAEKHHGNKLGGLVLHTYGVLKTLEAIIDLYMVNPFHNYGEMKDFDPDRLRAKVILHDLMKMEEYEIHPVIRRKPNRRMDHRVEGAVLVRRVNEACGNVLTEEQVDDLSYAILSHHGQYGTHEPKSLEDIFLHLADMVDARIVGASEN